MHLGRGGGASCSPCVVIEEEARGRDRDRGRGRGRGRGGGASCSPCCSGLSNKARNVIQQLLLLLLSQHLQLVQPLD